MTENLREFALKHLTDYYDLLRLPSISAQKEALPETAELLVKLFNELGATRVEKLGSFESAPAVFAEFKGNDPTKTVLFYQHYDVQPPEPLEKWESDPFEPTIREGKLYARGASDNKGELISRLVLVKYFKENGGLPVNVKFFVEGEEAVSYTHLRAHET